MDFDIKQAETIDNKNLTTISFQAKRFWNYPDKYYDIWKDELTITEEYISQNIVYKALISDTIVGFYSIVENKHDKYSGDILLENGYWLEHLFIHPNYMYQGIGTVLLHHAIGLTQKLCTNKLLIFVDPHAKGFYEKNGATFVRESPSSIAHRTIPVYEIQTGY